jgi:hypothetical protein
MPPRVCPKLPIKLITDPAVGGALHAIALKVADIRRARSLKAIEWQNPGKRQEVGTVAAAAAAAAAGAAAKAAAGRQQLVCSSGDTSDSVGTCCSCSGVLRLFCYELSVPAKAS